MKFIDWLITSKAEADTELADVGGFKCMAEGVAVMFWWWDGRDLDMVDNANPVIAEDATHVPDGSCD